MKKLLLLLLFATISSLAVVAQKMEKLNNDDINVDVTECYDTSIYHLKSQKTYSNLPTKITDKYRKTVWQPIKITVHAFYMGFNEQNHCYNVLIVLTVSDNDGGESVIGYGTACIPQVTRMNTSELPAGLREVNQCALDKLVDDVQGKWNLSDINRKSKELKQKLEEQLKQKKTSERK